MAVPPVSGIGRRRSFCRQWGVGSGQWTSLVAAVADRGVGSGMEQGAEGNSRDEHGIARKFRVGRPSDQSDPSDLSDLSDLLAPSKLTDSATMNWPPSANIFDTVFSRVRCLRQ